MTYHKLPAELCSRLVHNEIIKKNLESIIWFGSIRNGQDIHQESDYDIQIVLGKPSFKLTIEINNILKDYPDVDLSIMYMKDIYDQAGNVIFHDDTKGFFFMYVLASGEILYGKNVYTEIIEKLELEDSKPSILITIREYLSRLRIMAAQLPKDTLKFKKYSAKLFKDILIYYGDIPLRDMSKASNIEVCERIIAQHAFSNKSKVALASIADYEQNFTQEEMAALLSDYEQIVERICNE